MWRFVVLFASESEAKRYIIDTYTLIEWLQVKIVKRRGLFRIYKRVKR